MYAYQADSLFSLGYLGYFVSQIQLISLFVLHGYANFHTVYSLIEDPEVPTINDDTGLAYSRLTHIGK